MFDTTELRRISVGAGKIIMEIYQSDKFDIQLKSDEMESPLTKADLAANDYICSELKRLYPAINILSEEIKASDYSERKTWDKLFIVDPLDGTKEFIKRNGEFTVNIAYVENGVTMAGVVYAPALESLYYTKNGNSFKESANGTQKLPIFSENTMYRIVASRSHLNDATAKFVEDKKKELGEDRVELVSVGSSLKLCMIAEGLAEVYPRLAPTMEWDIAAAHAVAKGAGFEVLGFESGEPLEYNKEDLLNPYFIVE